MAQDVHRDLRLSETDSYALLTRCRAHDTTITALLNVLLTLTVVDNRDAIKSVKSVEIPFFPVYREDDLLDEYRNSAVCLRYCRHLFWMPVH